MSQAGAEKTEAKKRIRELRTEIREALGSNDRKKVDRLRRETKQLKRLTRQLAKTIASAPAAEEATAPASAAVGGAPSSGESPAGSGEA